MSELRCWPGCMTFTAFESTDGSTPAGTPCRVIKWVPRGRMICLADGRIQRILHGGWQVRFLDGTRGHYPDDQLLGPVAPRKPGRAKVATR